MALKQCYFMRCRKAARPNEGIGKISNTLLLMLHKQQVKSKLISNWINDWINRIERIVHGFIMVVAY